MGKKSTKNNLFDQQWYQQREKNYQICKEETNLLQFTNKHQLSHSLTYKPGVFAYNPDKIIGKADMLLGIQEEEEESKFDIDDARSDETKERVYHKQELADVIQSPFHDDIVENRPKEEVQSEEQKGA